MAKHYIAMNGLRGCMPDNVGVHDSLKSAIEWLDSLFCEDLSEDECNQMHGNLAQYGIHYFSDPGEAGAEYCQVLACDCRNPSIHEDT